MSPRRREPDPDQLPLPTPKPPRKMLAPPEVLARAYIAKRAKYPAVPGRVKLTFTLEAGVAERLSAMAIRSDQNIEAIVIELLTKGAE